MRRVLSRLPIIGLAGALITASVFALSSSAATSHARATPYRIALVIPDVTTNQLILNLQQGSQAAAKQAGVKLLITATGSTEAQVSAVQDAIAAHVDAIVYDTTNAAAMAPAIKKANAAGIPVICNNSCATQGKNAVTVTFNYKTMGLLTGKWIAKQLQGGKGNVGIIDTNRADESVAQIYKGINQGLKEAGASPKIIISPPTNWDPATALTVTQNFLTANPNLNVLVCLHDLVAAVCRQVLDSTHYASIPLAGEGGTCQGFQNILAGKQDFTVAEFLYKAGALGVQDAVDVLKGHTPKNTLVIAPMIGVSQASAKGMLTGKQPIPAGLGLGAALQAAKAGCKS
jgi:ribose transport system substrate-binding protein